MDFGLTVFSWSPLAAFDFWAYRLGVGVGVGFEGGFCFMRLFGGAGNVFWEGFFSELALRLWLLSSRVNREEAGLLSLRVSWVWFAAMDLFGLRDLNL